MHIQYRAPTAILMENWGDRLGERCSYFFVELSCKISLPQYASFNCKQLRIGENNRRKGFFKIKQFNASVSSGLSLPELDQNIPSTLAYYMTDKFSAQWFNLYFLIMAKSLELKVKPKLMEVFRGKDFSTYADYFLVASLFKNAVQVLHYIITFKY